MRLLLSAGQASDMGAVPALLAGLPTPGTVVADRGYDSNAVLDLIRQSGARPSIPSCSRRLVRRSIDPAIYRERNLVERFFCKLKQFRRVATRFDKLARNFLAAVALASTRLWLRAYESTPSASNSPLSRSSSFTSTPQPSAHIVPPSEPKLKLQAYADNFR